MSSIKKYILPLVIFLGVLILYIHNLARGTYGGDVGDLLATSIVMGVAHPPGYPLFTIFGFLLSRVHFISPAFMIGLISAVSGALGALFFYFLSLELTKSKLISIISTAILAFSYYFWFYSEIAEVFALNNLFVILLLLLAVLYALRKDIRYLFLLAFFTGLSATNHQTIIFIFPSLLILSLPNLIRDLRNPKNILYCLLLGLLGFSPYLYIPFASSHNPAINWDNVKDLNSFLRLFLRQDYGTFTIGQVSAPTLGQRFVILKIYLFDVLVQATIPVVFVSILGAVYALKNNKKIFFSFILAFILSGPFFITYAGFPFYSAFNIGVYERFIIMSFVILLMFFPFGLLLVKQVFNKVFSKKEYGIILLAAFLIIPLSLFKYNYPKTDLSGFSAGDNLGYNFLSSLPKNSVLMLSGDTVLFNTWYVHYGLGFRPDVEVVNLTGLSGSSFFAEKQMQFLKDNPKEKVDINLNTKVIMEIAKTRPVFSIMNVQLTTGKRLTWVPYGLSSRLLLNNSLPTKNLYEKQVLSLWNSYNIPDSSKNNLTLGSLTASDIPLFYSSRLIATGNYILENYKDKKNALYYFNKALETDNNNQAAYQVLGNFYVQEKKCTTAETDLKKAIDVSPFDPLSYFVLYYDYVDCLKNPSKAKSVVLQYNTLFKSNFYVDLTKTFGKTKK